MMNLARPSVILVFITIILLLCLSTAEMDDNPVVDGIPPFLLIYKNGTVFRNFTTLTVPPGEDPSTGVSSKDVNISSEVQARIFLPNLTTTSHDHDVKLPIFLWFHGGGFFAGSAFSATEFPFHNIIASRAGAIVISVNYRLVPENHLPIAYEDCWTALQWVAGHGNQTIGCDPWLVQYGDINKIFIGGDSGGGNIVHNLLMRAGLEQRRRGAVKISGGILTHAYFWGSNETNPNPLTEWFANKVWSLAYPTAPGGIDNPMVNPFSENAPSLSGLGTSKLFVSASELDFLNDIDIRYFNAVIDSGWKGKAKLVKVSGVGHSFYFDDLYTEKAQCLLTAMASFISQKESLEHDIHYCIDHNSTTAFTI